MDERLQTNLGNGTVVTQLNSGDDNDVYEAGNRSTSRWHRKEIGHVYQADGIDRE